MTLLLGCDFSSSRRAQAHRAGAGPRSRRPRAAHAAGEASSPLAAFGDWLRQPQALDRRLRFSLRPAARTGGASRLALQLARLHAALRGLTRPRSARPSPRSATRVRWAASSRTALRQAGRLQPVDEVGEPAGGLHAARRGAAAAGCRRAHAGPARKATRSVLRWKPIPACWRASCSAAAATRATTRPSRRPSADRAQGPDHRAGAGSHPAGAAPEVTHAQRDALVPTTPAATAWTPCCA
jgi:hypothetical protein